MEKTGCFLPHDLCPDDICGPVGLTGKEAYLQFTRSDILAVHPQIVET